MSAVRAVLGQAFRREDDDAPAAARSRRDWIVDSVRFLIAAVLALPTVMTNTRHGLHGPLLVLDAAGAAMACLALWGRRRWPLAVGLAVVAVQTVSPAAGAAGVVSLYTVAAYRRWQWALLVAGVQIALLPLWRVIQPQSLSLAVYYLADTFGLAVIVAWGMFRRTRLQAQRERARRVEAQEQLRIEQVRYAERTRIAREMHDVLAHRISLLSLHAGVLEFRPDAPPEEVARAAAVIRACAHQALGGERKTARDRSHLSRRSRRCRACSRNRAPRACASGPRSACRTWLSFRT
jgi:signal transduction histidine kinase